MASLNANQNMSSCWSDSASAPGMRYVRIRNISNRSHITRRRIDALVGPTGIAPATRTIISNCDGAILAVLDARIPTLHYFQRLGPVKV